MSAHQGPLQDRSTSENIPKGLNLLIVDDEPLARRRMYALCERLSNHFDSIDSIAIAGSGDEAMALISENQPNLLLLDVDMPGLSGMDVAGLCQHMEPVPQIIFTTAHRKYAVQAFRMEAVDYLLKPVKENLLDEALRRAVKRLDTGSGNRPARASYNLWVQDNGSSVQIRASDIERIEAERDYMRLCLAGHHYLVHQPMYVLEKKLPSDLFLRVHRSAMVRKNCIASIRRKGRRRYVVLHDGYEIDIGPSYLKKVLTEIGGQAGGSGLSDTVTE